MFSLEGSVRGAVELYLTTPMTTAQVVECLRLSDQTVPGTLAGDGSRYAGRMAKPIIPLETRRKAIELVLGGMQRSRPPNSLA